MSWTATSLTVEHYKRPEVKATILRYCQDGEAWRALNGDEGWYKTESPEGIVKLLTPDDYDQITERHKTLYATLDFLEPFVKTASEKWNEERNAPEHPIGTLKDCRAFTLSVDIDSIKGPNGEDIVTSPDIKKAVEDAGQFFVDYLRDHGISRSIHCLYSGGGIYVHVHHALFKAESDISPEKRERIFRSAGIAFNALIKDISTKFFELHPEHTGRVKFDQLNNQKRKFKCIFSIHKHLPYAVIPLRLDHVRIDFERARVPLSPEVLAEGDSWYRDYDLDELPKLVDLLEPYMKQAIEELDERSGRTGTFDIFRYPVPIPSERFPPCIKNVISEVAPGQGPHRALAVLAAYLYQAGWSEKDAFSLWEPIAGRVGVESRIFDCWHGLMNCPNCSTIQKSSSGYPRVGLGGLKYCEPDEQCRGILWPGEYSLRACVRLCGDLMENINNAMDALIAYNNPPIIYQRGGSLCRVIPVADDRYRVEDMTDYALRNEMSRASTFEKFKANKDGGDWKECPPPLELVRGILALGTWNIPFINGLINAPGIRQDGSLLLEPGYDVATGMCYMPEASLSIPPIQDKPTKEDAEKAAKFFMDEVLHDFPFVDGVSKSNALAAFLTPVVRQMIDGCIPMCLIDKPSPGTGASKLLDLISLVVTGKPMAATSPAESEEEWRKLISSLMRDGTPLICLDNIASDLKADALSRALSSTIWKDRVLGKPDAVEYPQKACWYATGNNLTLNGDIPRRSYLIQMDAKMARPWERKAGDFKHSDINRWVKENRGKLLASLLIMARAWVVAGRPKECDKIIGGFDEWVEVTGGILAYAGVTQFLDNLVKLYEEVDVGSDEWSEFFATWYDLYKEEGLTSSGILARLENPDITLGKCVPTDLAEKIKYHSPGNAKKVSFALRKKLNVRHNNGLMLTQIDDAHTKTKLWKVMEAKDHAICG